MGKDHTRFDATTTEQKRAKHPQKLSILKQSKINNENSTKYHHPQKILHSKKLYRASLSKIVSDSIQAKKKKVS